MLLRLSPNKMTLNGIHWLDEKTLSIKINDDSFWSFKNENHWDRVFQCQISYHFLKLTLELINTFSWAALRQCPINHSFWSTVVCSPPVSNRPSFLVVGQFSLDSPNEIINNFVFLRAVWSLTLVHFKTRNS